MENADMKAVDLDKFDSTERTEASHVETLWSCRICEKYLKIELKLIGHMKGAHKRKEKKKEEEEG